MPSSSNAGRAVAGRTPGVRAPRPGGGVVVPRPAARHVEPLEDRRLMCDWGWAEASAYAPAARGAYTAPADAVQFVHGGALHLDAAGTAAAELPSPVGMGPFVTAVLATSVAPGTTTLRIDSAGTSSYTDTAGRVWSADTGFSGGSTSVGSYAVANTADDRLYYTRRWGEFNYSRSVANGAYQLRLHFADPLYTTSGKRLFNVYAENTQVLSNFDIAANGGGKAALVKSIPVTVADGNLSVSFRKGSIENPIVSAIELVPDGTASAPSKPAAPTGLTTAAGPASVTLRWKDVSSVESGFRIERRDGTSTTWRQIGTAGANATSYADSSNLASATTYAYRVRAYNAAGTSAYSNTSSAYVAFGTITWKTGAPSPITRAEAARAVVNGKMYVFGGYYNSAIQAARRCDVYNPATNTWSRIADMPTAITHQGMVVDGTTVWLVGGYVGDHPGPGTRQVWKYDTLKNAWSRGPDLPDERGAGAAAIVGRTIYFFGGMNEQRTVDMGTHWALDLANQSAGWKRLADMPNGRNHLSGVALGGKVYAIGGHYYQEWDAVTQREVDAYDPATNTWSRVADTPTLRSQTPAATFVHAGRIVLVGGADRTQHSTDVISAYDPVRNRWDTIGRLPAARRATCAGVIGGRLIVTTGNDPYPSTTTWISNVLGEFD